ncbi:MAG: hypothetical protein IKF97_03365 [Clostridia bacterium]|nr:hypothetical protein [Clostridia bacterium]
MKVLFAVSNDDITEAIVKRYQRDYKEIISYKNVYYFNAILKEIQKDKSYDRIVISEELEAFTNTQFDQMDKFIFEKLDSISDEAANSRGDNTPIILICSDRRVKGDEMLIKLFGIGIYDALIGNDRSIDEVCKLINKSRSKKEAKIYYRVDSDEVKYQSENENDVSEQEIQNILAHYKRLGKNEDKYVTSFNNIVAQYNDAQLRIISKFLPLNVRAVLEEKSPKYQQIMSFNNSVSNNIRRNSKKEEDLGPSGKLLKSNNQSTTFTGPIVIPSSVDTTNVKKLARKQPENTSQISKDLEDLFSDDNDEIIKPVKNDFVEENKENLNNIETIEKPKVQKRRGRPRKNPLPPVEDDMILPGFDEKNDDDILPGLSSSIEDDQILPGFDMPKDEKIEPDTDMNEPVLEPEQEQEDETVLPGFENVSNSAHKPILPGFEYVHNDKYNENPFDDIKPEPINSTQMNDLDSMSLNSNYDTQFNKTENYDLSNILSSDKKIAAFVGTSKNGTSFIVNNLAEYASSMGLNVAILDTTVNKNSYYIYTKNEEELRKVAEQCLENLVNGQANGIQVNRNLTVYTSLPEERDNLENVNQIIESLVRKHNLVLIDCDFNTPVGYFANAQDVYLVQSLDILTIQPLTAFLRELKAKGVLDDNKIRIILNKYVRVRGISERTIIGGMSKYNDPAMSFMTDLFDVDNVDYRTIPFDQDIYTRYLESIINCDISIKGYSKQFMQILKDLNNWVYPMNNGGSAYRPKSIQSYNNTFSSDISNTLNQMKRNY